MMITGDTTFGHPIREIKMMMKMVKVRDMRWNEFKKEMQYIKKEMFNSKVIVVDNVNWMKKQSILNSKKLGVIILAIADVQSLHWPHWQMWFGIYW